MIVVAIVTEYDIDQTECLLYMLIRVLYSGLYTLDETREVS